MTSSLSPLYTQSRTISALVAGAKRNNPSGSFTSWDSSPHRNASIPEASSAGGKLCFPNCARSSAAAPNAYITLAFAIIQGSAGLERAEYTTACGPRGAAAAAFECGDVLGASGFLSSNGFLKRLIFSFQRLFSIVSQEYCTSE